MAVRSDIIRLATQNGGFLSRDQLEASGLSSSSIDRLVNKGDIVPFKHGVYQVVPSNDHADLLRGAMLAIPKGVASHQSAAHLLRFPELPRLVPTITVPSHTTHRFPGITVRRGNDLSPSHIINVDGIPVTNPARTLFDLAGVLKFRVFDRIAESAVIAERVTLDQVVAVTSELGRRGKPGTVAANTFIAARLFSLDATVLERKGRRILQSISPPDTVSEYPIPWSRGRRFDDAFPDHRLAIEWDSRSWHQRRSEMWSDRKRDRDAVGHGWVVLRFTWEDVTNHSDDVARSVADALKQRDSRRTLGS